MMPKTSVSSDSLNNQDSGAINRLNLAAILVALVNFGVEWDRRNRETDRRAAQEQRRRDDSARAADEQAEERERTARRARIEARCRAAQTRFQLEPSDEKRLALATGLALGWWCENFVEAHGEETRESN